MNRLKRIKTILCTLYRYRLAELIASLVRPGWARTFLNMLPQSSKFKQEMPAVRLRLALESLGPIFIKFGQVLSTRPDLIPHDYAVELARLQDKVPPFDAQLSRSQIEKSLGQSIDTLYAEFETEPVASASIAQVHKARLHSGEQVAVKVLRPNLLPVIEQDLSLMRFGAGWVERLFSDGKRLKPREVVAEFDKYLHDELDLMREAANASQLGRNFQNSNMLIVRRCARLRVRRFVNHNGWAAPSRQNLPASRLHLDGLDEMGWFSEQSFSSFSGFFVQMPPAHLCADDPICP